MFGMPAGSALGEVVHELTQAHDRTHAGVTGQEPALLDLLRVAIKSDVGGAEGGGGGQRASVPFDPIALELWDSVNRESFRWFNGGPAYRALPITSRLQHYASHLAGVGTIEGQGDLLALCLGWKREIRDMFEPPTRVSLRGVTCPACSMDHLTKVAADGEKTYTAALLIHVSEDPVRAECLVCGEDWLNGELLDLVAGKMPASNTNGRLA